MAATVARVDLTILYLAVADMIAKPASSDTWTLVAGGAILALAVLTALSRNTPRLQPGTTR